MKLSAPLPAILLLLASLSAASCSGDHEHAAGHGGAQAAAEPHASDELPGVALICGCALPEVAHCSEWARIDGEHVELVLPATSDLGSMPFCGRTGLRAEVEGSLVDGKYVVTNFRYLP